MSFLRLAACLLACGALGSACTKPAATPAATANSAAALSTASGAHSPCDLLNQTEAEAAVGAPLPQNSVNPALGMCGYTSADFSEGAQLTVGEWTSIRAAATGGPKQPAPVSGVGDEGLYFTQQETGAGPLYVRHGTQGILLVLNGAKIDHMPGADALAVEQALAAKIVARM